MAKKLIPLSDVLRALDREIDRAGGVRAFARLVGLSPQYISRVRGQISPPSDKLLDAIGYRDAGRWYERK